MSALAALGSALLQPHPLRWAIPKADATDNAAIEGRGHLCGIVLLAGAPLHWLLHRPRIGAARLTQQQFALKDARGQLQVIRQLCAKWEDSLRLAAASHQPYLRLLLTGVVAMPRLATPPNSLIPRAPSTRCKPISRSSEPSFRSPRCVSCDTSRFDANGDLRRREIKDDILANYAHVYNIYVCVSIYTYMYIYVYILIYVFFFLLFMKMNCIYTIVVQYNIRFPCEVSIEWASSGESWQGYRKVVGLLR